MKTEILFFSLLSLAVWTEHKASSQTKTGTDSSGIEKNIIHLKRIEKKWKDSLAVTVDSATNGLVKFDELSKRFDKVSQVQKSTTVNLKTNNAVQDSILHILSEPKLLRTDTVIVEIKSVEPPVTRQAPVPPPTEDKKTNLWQKIFKWL